MELEKILGKYSEKYDMELSELNERYNNILASIDGKKSDGIKRRIALTKLTNEIKRDKGISATGDRFEGVFIATTGPWDDIERTKRISLAIYRKNKERAINEGWTNEDGVVLDRRDWVLGRDNPRKGMPIEGESWRNEMWGFVRKDIQEDYEFAKMRAFDDAAKKEVPLNTPVSFYAIDKGTQGNMLSLNASQNTKFDEQEDLEIDIEELLRERDMVIKLSELKDWFEINKDDYNNLLIVEGCVYRTSGSDYEGRKYVSLTDPEDPELLQFFSIPEHIELNCNEDDSIILIGNTRETDRGMWTNVYGIYPLDQYSIPLLT